MFIFLFVFFNDEPFANILENHDLLAFLRGNVRFPNFFKNVTHNCVGNLKFMRFGKLMVKQF